MDEPSTEEYLRFKELMREVVVVNNIHPHVIAKSCAALLMTYFEAQKADPADVEQYFVNLIRQYKINVGYHG